MRFQLLDLLASEGFRHVTYAAILAILIVYTVKTFLKIWKLPPGPWGLPFIGYLPFLTKEPHLKFIELSKKYGKIFSVNLGPAMGYAIIINGYEGTKEALLTDELLGRPKVTPFTSLMDTVSFGDTSNRLWREHRRFVLRVLHELGFGRSLMEERVMDELAHFMKKIDTTRRENKQNLVNIDAIFSGSAANIITSLVFGHRFEYDDQDQKVIDEGLAIFPQFAKVAGVFALFPFLTNICKKYGWLGLDKVRRANENLNILYDKEIEKHEKAGLSEDGDYRDYTEAYLLEQKSGRVTDPELQFDKFLSPNIKALYFGGSGTVQTTMNWAMLLMATHPEAQRRVQQEIDDVIGDRAPTYASRQHMQYTQAAIHEVERWASIVTMNIARRALEDCKVQGVFIPKGVTVFTNLWSVHRGERFENPDQYNPDRFMKDGKFQKCDAVISFSAGKRNCPGEPLGVLEEFLYFTLILQKFNVKEPPEGASLRMRTGITLQPADPPILVFEPRQSMKT